MIDSANNGMAGFDIVRPGLIMVATGEYAIARHPEVLSTAALGSCVGITIWDPFRHVGGMAHVMLPTPSDTAVKGNVSRFASIAVPEMVERLSTGGARHRLVAKLCGGSAMFKGDSKLASIGERNVEEARHQLALLRVPVVAEDTGGSHARTIELRLDTGIVVVRSYAYGIREI